MLYRFFFALNCIFSYIKPIEATLGKMASPKQEGGRKMSTYRIYVTPVANLSLLLLLLTFLTFTQQMKKNQRHEK